MLLSATCRCGGVPASAASPYHWIASRYLESDSAFWPACNAASAASSFISAPRASRSADRYHSSATAASPLAAAFSIRAWKSVCASCARAATAPRATAISARILTDRKSTRLNSSHLVISYAVFCLKKNYRRTHADAPGLGELAYKWFEKTCGAKKHYNRNFSATSNIFFFK